MNDSESKFWLDQVVADVLETSDKKSFLVSSGHSPSGVYHVGTLREILTANAVAQVISSKYGRSAKHIDFVDDFDVLRKIPAGVPQKFESELGKPLYLVEDPFDCNCGSWADHWLGELYNSTSDIFTFEFQIVRAHEEYLEGKYSTYIEKSLAGIDEIRQVLDSVSGRELPLDWAPVQILSDNNKLTEWKFAGWDKESREVHWKDSSGKEGSVSYANGRVKLDWRLDWPARWERLGVDIEPFGKDHATKGGSYETGSILVSRIFGGQAPYPVPYDFVNKLGETKKMSKSAGDVLKPSDLLDIMPAEIVRYFMLRSQPKKVLSVDSGLGIYRLLDEYSKVEHAVINHEENEFSRAYEVASEDVKTRNVSEVPFSHLVTAYQSSRGEEDGIKAILQRTGYELDDFDLIQKEILFVRKWLTEYAPDEVKFEIQQSVPAVDLSDGQKKLLNDLANKLSKSDMDAQAIHEAIYALKDEHKLSPQEAFQAVYRVILGQDQGPKVGWFVSSLDKDFLVPRFRLEA